MYELIHCPVCDKECSSQATRCPHCGHPLNEPATAETEVIPRTPPIDPRNSMDPPPKTWLVESILATVFCCLIGIGGIIYASKVENLWYQGRKAEAYEASKMAKTWTIVSLSIGIFIVLAYLAYMALIVFGVIAGMGSMSNMKDW